MANIPYPSEVKQKRSTWGEDSVVLCLVYTHVMFRLGFTSATQPPSATHFELPPPVATDVFVCGCFCFVFS